MTSNEEKINEFLKRVGIQTLLKQSQESNNVKNISINYMGINILVTLDKDVYFGLKAFVGYLPKTAIAAFYRQLLLLNLTMVGMSYALLEPNLVILNASRNVDGLDFNEFKWVLETMAQYYYRDFTSFKQQFQMPLESP